MTPDIGTLIPHAGAMCLLERIEHWDADSITCSSATHLDPANPLRRNGQLSPVCGIEYALQAAAVHGALTAGARQPIGWLASLRMRSLSPSRLDDQTLGRLLAYATREHGDSQGLLYDIRLTATGGRTLLEGRAAIMLRPA